MNNKYFCFINPKTKTLMLHDNLRPLTLLILVFCFAIPSSFAQTDSTLHKEIDALKKELKDYQHRFVVLEKGIDDITWFQRVDDVAHIDKVRLTSTPRWKAKDADDRFAVNKLQFYYYVFIPKTVDTNKKYPLIVLNTVAFTLTSPLITNTLSVN